MDLGLGGKKAIVTGGSRGIGRATALALAAEGAEVAIVARGEAELAEVAGAIDATGGRAHVVVGDVATRDGAYDAISRSVAALGGLDVLVNNVGGSLGSGAFDRADDEAWARVLDLNLMSAVWCSRGALGALQTSGGGTIVLVSSICGLEYCTSAPYTAAKGALAALAKEMGVDLAPKRIRVVAVAPGSILFPGGSWDKRHTTHPDLVARMLEHELPWKRFGTAEEVADAITFVASPRASWITATSVVVDGGQSRGV
jgi:3-oxoacyl-[acyl-carrier protein] reductase